MQSVVTYIRNLLGWNDEDFNVRSSCKRDRNEDDFAFDDDTPALKRLKQLKKTSFPSVMSSKDLWDRDDRPSSSSSNVRYVPIQIEPGHPSTSTPNELPGKLGSRIRNVPVKLVGVSRNPSTSTPARKPRLHTPVRPVIHAVIDDDDDPEITLIEKKPESSRKNSKVYVIDEDDNERPEDDVIFVKKISTPPPVRPYKFFVSDYDETDSKEDNSVQYYRLSKINDRSGSNVSPRSFSKFKEPPGITKSYKKPAPQLPRWMQTSKISNLSSNRSKLLNGNFRNTLSQVFDLDEKRNYQELIRRVTGTSRPFATTRAPEIINLAEDSASFRLTQRAQKKALNEIKLVEKGLSIDKENESAKEYDPITVASINSSDSEIEIVTSETSSSSTRIDPINTLKDSYRDNPVTGKDWLSKLDGKYKKKKQQTQEKLKEVRLEDDIISKVNCEQKLAHLQHKLKYELSIPESLFEEVEPSAELPQLTPEQEKLIDKALGPGPPNQLLVEKFNLRIHRRDLQTLCGLNWLNDEVINFYMNLLMQRSEERKDLPKVYATNTFFYPKLMQSGQAGLRRWTRKVDIFAHNLMVVPVHLGVHWCVSLVDFSKKRIEYLDSMGGRNVACLNALLQYLRDEHKDKKGEPFNDEGWKTECLKDIPQQMNGSDCGMFACTFAEFSARGARYTFDQSHMPYLRRKAALEIVTGKLLL